MLAVEPVRLPESPYVFEVNSRKAIPVRAVPFISSWAISPDMIARWFAQRDGFCLPPEAKAFHIVDSRIVEIPVRRWDMVLDDLECLEAKLRVAELAEGANYPEWKRLAPSFLLPVFIWMDDLEKAWQCFARQSRLYHEGASLFTDFREQRLEYTPFLDEQMRCVVLENMPSGGGKQVAEIGSDTGKSIESSHLPSLTTQITPLAPDDSADNFMNSQELKLECSPFWDAQLRCIVLENMPSGGGRQVAEAGSDAGKAIESSQLPNLASQSAPPAPDVSADNWKMAIQAQAAILWKKYLGMGCQPTKHALKADLAKWCRENKVVTSRGLVPTEEYLYRHVLRTWQPPT